MSEEKRMAGDYEIIQAVHIGDREIVVGENQADEQGLPYLVAYYESNAILGRYYDAIGSDDFTEIMEIYGQRIMEQAQKKTEDMIGRQQLMFNKARQLSIDRELADITAGVEVSA